MNLKNIAKGTSESFKVDEGLILLKHTNESEHEENFNYNIGKDYIQFHFCLKGFSNFLFNFWGTITIFMLVLYLLNCHF